MAGRYRFRRDALRISSQPSQQPQHHLVEDESSGVSHRLYGKELGVAELFNGRRSVEQIAALARERIGLAVEAVDVDRFAQQLVALGFAELVE